MNSDADSDWEYEYDDTEREDIYFTLDLTTHVPNAIQEKQYAKNGKLIAPAASERNDTASGRALTAAHGEVDGQDDREDRINHPNVNATSIAEGGQLQILDLHSEKPYVKFNNSFYSCYWFTDLGTQFWITNPGVVADPKYSGHVLDVVASSQTRLVAMPANLKRKREVTHPEPNASQPPTQSTEVDDDGASDASDMDAKYESVEYFQQDPNIPMVIPRHKIKDPHLEAQANFMERLSALKLRKGEPDAHKIPMRVPVYYKGAPNADELRAAHGITDEPPRPLPIARASVASRVSPTHGDDAGEGAHPADEGSPAASTPLPKFVGRSRGGSRGGSRRGGAPSHASRRSNLGLELMGDSSAVVPKKRGRKSNAEKARLAAEAAGGGAEVEVEVEVEAEAVVQPAVIPKKRGRKSNAEKARLAAEAAEAEARAVAEVADGVADAKPFALDPLLASNDHSQTTPAVAAEAAPEEEVESITEESGRPPRKRRRNPAEMAEAQGVEADREAE